MALSCSCFIESVIAATSQRFTMPPPVYNDFRNAAFNFLEHVTILRGHYQGQDPPQPLFNITIKFHDLVHCVDQARYLHPYMTWCYSGESYMNRVKKVVQSCCRGTGPSKISKKFFEKVCTGHHIRLVDQARWFSSP